MFAELPKQFCITKFVIQGTASGTTNDDAQTFRRSLAVSNGANGIPDYSLP